MNPSDIDLWHMTRALELAAQGRGHVEPNPMVGCVVTQGAEIIGEGFHRRFGGPHAEVEALAVAGKRAVGGTMYVTLEPCCHHGKTPPCTEAVIASGVRRVVIAQRDPFPAVDGGGIERLRAAGLEIEVGLCEAEARWLNAPYLKLLTKGRPWMIAKWAMTLDGKLATRAGESRWISGEASRAVAHELRGRVDAILVGRGTVEADDPLLTARLQLAVGRMQEAVKNPKNDATAGLPPASCQLPTGLPRVATRVVLDSRGSLSSQSQLVRTVRDAPVLVAVGPQASAQDRERLTKAGCDVFVADAPEPLARMRQLLDELGRRRMTNVLVEGGAEVLGSLLDAHEIDEVHVFIAPKLVGGSEAASPVAGLGIEQMSQALELDRPQVRTLGADVYVEGRCKADGGRGKA